MQLLSPWWRRLAAGGQKAADDRLPILLYHKVGEYTPGAAAKAHYVAPAQFRAHMSLLAAWGCETVGSDDIVRHVGGAPRGEGAPPTGEAIGIGRPIAITFDDGYECVYSQAYPVLKELGLRALVFVVVGNIGGINDWERPRPAVAEPLLTAAHIAELAAAGIEFGSHGMQHQAMTRLEPAHLGADLAQSKRMLENITGKAVRVVAYPYGDHNERVRAAAAAAGYLAGCTTERGVNLPGADPFALKRINIRRYNYLPLFALKLRRAYGSARRRR